MKKRNKPWPHHPMIGKEEIKAVNKVLKSGNLSSFLANPDKILGGKKIQELERHFRNYHGVKHAISFNSGTSALHAAIIASGIKPLDEVITTPYTFTATASCILMANAIPVFSDIQQDTFNIDPKKIAERLIIPNSIKAIIPVHLFGNPVDMDEIMEIAKMYNLRVIEDCAQAPGAEYKKKKVGTIGDCAIFSLTETKNISSGEGGMLITDNEEIADIARLVRNHGEAIIEQSKHRTYNSTILGYNYRMTEVDAAIGVEQFKKLDKLNNIRIKLAKFLNEGFKEIPQIKPQVVRDGKKCVYNIYSFRLDGNRDKFIQLANKNGIPYSGGYIKPLYYSKIYHENKPFFYKYYKGTINYDSGLCPVAEHCYFKEMVITSVVRPPATLSDMKDIISITKEALIDE
ncbi:MAG: DegT/DnrJ/EryC1/StrS family aminotransferase [Actinobacteria bacterium]|nr:DegT/DnrJ/EryC1/StrS family aminotransferase [Actinomycetota bacterium]